MAKFTVMLKEGYKFEVESDIVQPSHNPGCVVFQNTSIVQDSLRRDSFGAPSYLNQYETIAVFNDVLSVVRVVE